MSFVYIDWLTAFSLTAQPPPHFSHTWKSLKISSGTHKRSSPSLSEWKTTVSDLTDQQRCSFPFHRRSENMFISKHYLLWTWHLTDRLWNKLLSCDNGLPWCVLVTEHEQTHKTSVRCCLPKERCEFMILYRVAFKHGSIWSTSIYLFSFQI